MNPDFFKHFRILRCELVISGEMADFIIDEAKTVKCKFVLTEYRLIIKLLPQYEVDNDNKDDPIPIHLPVEALPDYDINYLHCPVYSIAKVEKSIDKKLLTKIKIDIATKDNRSYSLYFDSLSNTNIYSVLSEALRPKDGNVFSVFAKKYREYHPVNNNGWTIYDCTKEYARQSVGGDTSGNTNKYIVRTNYNAQFNICDTYPEITYHPIAIDENDVREGSLFRTRQRYPTLAYYHKPNNGSLWRSSQTKSGLTNNRSTIDEKVLSAIADISLGPKKLIVYDARPYLAAYANKIKGAGFEVVENYSRAEIIFCEIDHIHAVRSAYQKLMLLVDPNTLNGNKNFYSQYETTGWCQFIYQIIKSSINVMRSVKEGYSVLVHCSDGWDRASQLTSFSQLLIDPYYRTLEGFIVLIEKEFLSFGHQFRTRSGFCKSDELDEMQVSPVFLQWLDCVHQVLVQYPFYFEFNMDLLLFIAYHLNSCKYGTFLYNCEKERREKGAHNKTVSIWTDVLEYKSHFINVYYDKETSKEYFMLESFPMHKVRLWEEYFNRFNMVPVYGKELVLRMKESVDGDGDCDNEMSGGEMMSTMEELNIVDRPFEMKPVSNVGIMEMNKMRDVMEIRRLKEENELMKKWIREQIMEGYIKFVPEGVKGVIDGKIKIK